MSNAIYPFLLRGLGYTVTRTEEFDTIVQSSPSRIETRIAQTQNPTRHWQFVYELLADDPTSLTAGLGFTDLQTLRGFYLARQGQFDDFLYDDPDDDSVGPGLLPDSETANLGAQLQIVQDAFTGIWYSPIQRLAGGQFYEDITDLGASGITVFANGLLQSNGLQYTIGGPGLAINGASYMGLYLQWSSEPVPPITAQFNFFWRCRFETDTQDFEKFVHQKWTIGGSEGKNGSGVLKIVTARTSLI